MYKENLYSLLNYCTVNLFKLDKINQTQYLLCHIKYLSPFRRLLQLIPV